MCFQDAGFNRSRLTELAEKLFTLAQLNLRLEQPEGDDTVSRNLRALKRASDSYARPSLLYYPSNSDPSQHLRLIVKASRFVTSYVSKPYPLQLLLASKTAEEIRKFNNKVQELLDRFAGHEVCCAPFFLDAAAIYAVSAARC